MPVTKVYWEWEEAFDKYGFDDGDGLVMTFRVADELERAGYVVSLVQWGLHNTTIESISKNDETLYPPADEDGEGVYQPGYDDPRAALPPEVIELLDEAFPAGMEEEG